MPKQEIEMDRSASSFLQTRDRLLKGEREVVGLIILVTARAKIVQSLSTRLVDDRTIALAI